MLEIESEVLGSSRETAAASPKAKPPMVTLAEMEAGYIRDVLNETSWRISGPGGAAVVLGVHPNTLRSRMERLGITRSR